MTKKSFKTFFSTPFYLESSSLTIKRFINNKPDFVSKKVYENNETEKFLEDAEKYLTYIKEYIEKHSIEKNLIPSYTKLSIHLIDYGEDGVAAHGFLKEKNLSLKDFLSLNLRERISEELKEAFIENPDFPAVFFSLESFLLIYLGEETIHFKVLIEADFMKLDLF